MFSDRMALQIADIAKESGLSEVGMLSIVEVETAGNPFEDDGATPRFLFERHIFYRELREREPAKLKIAQRAGLAIPAWDPPAQYRDERTSAERLELIERAKEIDEECALRAASWGLPQIMGGECLEVGFPTARMMVDAMRGNAAVQITLMAKFLKSRHLTAAIAEGDWAYVALRYNGSGYRRNHYDTRLAAAARRWERRLPELRAGGISEDPPETSLNRDAVLHIQNKLRRLGYHEVGEVDGRWGDKTSAAIFAFQRHEGIAATGHYDKETARLLDNADVSTHSRPVSQDREESTLDDLREKGSRTIAKADAADTVGKIKVGTGVVLGGGTAIDATINSAQDTVDKVNQVRGLWDSIHDVLPLTERQAILLLVGVLLVVGGYLVVRYAKNIKAARLEDYRTGVHAGIART